MNKTHEFYMQRCFELALKGTGLVSPNPLVGAVIVKEGFIISEGFHAKVGLPHAEADALNKAQSSVEGATLYCNLEPCCHTNKRTPPCAQRIIASGIKKVVIANLDPNPQVAGEGVKLMQQHGLEVITGILEDQGQQLNEIFFHHIQHNRPFVHLKFAQSLDGKIATVNQDSKWITSEKARLHVHQNRAHYDSILVGAQTVRSDNPKLTVRLPDRPELAIKRLILSKSGQLPDSSHVLADEFKDQTFVVIPEDMLGLFSFQTIACPLTQEGEFDLVKLLSLLYQKLAITSLYVEGGEQVLTSFIKQKCFDRISIYIAPKIVGLGKNAIGDLGVKVMQESLSLENFKWQELGTDILFTARRTSCLQD
jgi:diaminohydroxyphosphoribosylaminopyrimidine deaminase / 5-amino-6-(5-phosphoribosylamino)uracil reductase